MSAISFDIRGLEVLDRLRDEFGEKRADAIATQASMRAAKQVRTRLARRIAAETGIKKSLIDRLLTTWMRNGVVTLRFAGTGRFGRGFIRPRDLGLSVPKVGRYESTGRPRYGMPSTTKPGARSYPLGFVVNSLKGDSERTTSVHRFGPFDGRVGKKTQLFRRLGPRRKPIELVPGVRLAEIVDLPPMVAEANTEMARLIESEIERRFIVELTRVAQKSAAQASRVLPGTP